MTTDIFSFGSLFPTLSGTDIGTAISAIGLFVGLYTLLKVKKVADAQVEERRVTQELLDVDQIESDLNRVIHMLSEIRGPEAKLLSNDISKRLGAIQGTRRAITQKPKKTLSGKDLFIEKGFFSQEHVLEIIERSKNSVDIMTGSTRLVTGYFIMERIREACERGVIIRVIGIDPDSPDEILLDASRTVSNPAPSTANEYRSMMLDNHNAIISNVGNWKNEKARSRFEYRALQGVPRVSIARSDSTINLGFLQLYRDAQPISIDQRHYLQIPCGDSLGEVVKKHFEIGWNSARPIFPETNPVS